MGGEICVRVRVRYEYDNKLSASHRILYDMHSASAEYFSDILWSDIK